jgi:NAD(P)-dependent dehydrogenase (short-subunit alcohol dehydrogenase family)
VTIEALDVANDADIAKFAKKLKGEAIDLLINHAGIYGPRSGSDTDAWLEVIRVNTVAPFRMAEAFAPHVARSKQKTIANITSVMGSIASNESGGSPIYRSSKAALNMVMKGLSQELKSRGVTVAVFHPGWVKTDMGGTSAPVAIPDSIGGLRKVIAKLKPADTGKFFNYDGKPLPW